MFILELSKYIARVAVKEAQESGMKVKLMLTFTVIPTYLYFAVKFNSWWGSPILPSIESSIWLPGTILIIWVFVFYAMAKKSYLLEEAMKPKTQLLVGYDYPLIEEAVSVGVLEHQRYPLRIGIKNLSSDSMSIALKIDTIEQDGHKTYLNLPLLINNNQPWPFFKQNSIEYFELGQFDSEKDGSNAVITLSNSDIKIKTLATLTLNIIPNGPGPDEVYQVHLGFNPDSSLTYKMKN